MLVGIKNGIRINAYILSEEDKIKIRETTITCPVCNEKVILVDGTKVITHFRHKPNSNCQNSGETQEHIKMKVACYNILKKQSNVKELELEYKVVNQIADVIFRIGEKICIIECQCTPISKEEIDSRTKGWEEKGCFVVWIYGEKFLTSIDDEIENSLYKVRKAIRNKSQFYIFNSNLFLKAFPESVEGYNEFMGYSYYKKTIKKIKFNPIYNPTFCYTDYKGYKRVYLK